jgi:hypothetical protein
MDTSTSITDDTPNADSGRRGNRGLRITVAALGIVAVAALAWDVASRRELSDAAAERDDAQAQVIRDRDELQKTRDAAKEAQENLRLHREQYQARLAIAPEVVRLGRALADAQQAVVATTGEMRAALERNAPAAYNAALLRYREASANRDELNRQLQEASVALARA